MSCANPVNSPLYVDTGTCLNVAKSSNVSVSKHSYVNIGGMKASDLMKLCRLEWMTLLPAKDYRNMSFKEIHSQLAYGFELSWHNSSITVLLTGIISRQPTVDLTVIHLFLLNSLHLKCLRTQERNARVFNNHHKEAATLSKEAMMQLRILLLHYKKPIPAWGPLHAKLIIGLVPIGVMLGPLDFLCGLRVVPAGMGCQGSSPRSSSGAVGLRKITCWAGRFLRLGEGLSHD
ncbi:hypothetical protein DKX38_011809 [Salix brachista]|uniref:Uncharacterized protein n=1 Tax=Salix brachista TaxID=2182728 RepID=A0A5N5M2I0_9ROSI|nr:hypothetical protein DKX38_011809 [Salix brachista]